ncbi:hypothetical protein GCM10011609_42560 [Lentzea pudingi]|uniref:Methyltransferase n=1 Tax=Lentzea pudingi TaxID=1789439 RepID=A0ABQ2I3R7_9PSEU|nr:site-specific DNA-methyltransferase [Lentzea pudingi]GGM99677.1 hypothetical protein GCM10011609_42560 [Lentzea pudingi]
MTGQGDSIFTVHRADSRRLESYLRRAAVALDPQQPDAPILTATVTSPPYSSLIDYGVENQIGRGQNDDDYLADCKNIFDVLYRRTQDDGCLWLVADTYLKPQKQSRRGPRDPRPSSLRPLPFELAQLAGQAGWILREVIIWHKDKTRPWSHHGRLRNSFEYVLLLVKTSDFKFHSSRLRDASQIAHWWVRYPERYNPQGKAPDNIWHIPIPTQGSWANAAVQHACPFPPDLVSRLLMLSTDEGDIVCDPFAGSGTVAAVAEAMGRRPIGTELNPKFVEAYKKLVRPDILSKMAKTASRDKSDGPTPRTVVHLRALKYPKALFTTVRSRFPELKIPSVGIVLVEKTNPESTSGTLVQLTCIFVADDATAAERDDLARAFKEVAGKAPLTKYGVAGDISVVAEADAIRLLGERKLYLYEHGHTWVASGKINTSDALSVPTSVKRGHYIPIVSNVHVSIKEDHVGDLASEKTK